MEWAGKEVQHVMLDTDRHPLLKLLGGWATPLKNMKVNWDDYSQYMGK